MWETLTRKFEDPTLARINLLLSWFVGFILFLTCVIYAGVRGNYAYNHLPATQTDFITQSSVNFPAVTVCPLEKYTPLTPIECLHESNGVEDANCSAYIHPDTYTFEGNLLNCFTFNDPSDSSKVINCGASTDELAVVNIINGTGAHEEVGAFVMIHDQGTTDTLNDYNGFVVDAGKLTEFWLQKYTITHIDGSTQNKWYAKMTSATLRYPSQNPNNTLSALVIDMDFSFTSVGVYQSMEYYVYTRNNWIGEVGGLAALLLFLHGAFMVIAMAIIEQLYTRRNAGRRLPVTHSSDMKVPLNEI